MTKIKSALISVSDKKNLKTLLFNLKKYNINIISSGGTFKYIKKLGFKCLEVSEYTSFPEILDGRVKTLHPKIHAGILSKRKNKLHIKELKKNNFDEIDLIIVNFYPFEKVLKSKKNHSNIIENIDIGGPTLVRSAAKNYNDVTVITSLNQYKELIEELNKNKGKTTLDYRLKMSEVAFAETAYYDSIIANYFNIKTNNEFPKKKLIHSHLIEKLKYGENPRQNAAIYSLDNNQNIKQLSGKKLSYNNYNDILSALTISKSFPKNTGTLILKHATPCGVSIDNNKVRSYKLALASDPVSAFGGVVFCNYKINVKLAYELNKIFFEVVIGNGIEKKALTILKKRKNLRIIDASKIQLNNTNNITKNLNSILIQSGDNKIFSKKNFKVVSKYKPSQKTLSNLIFAFNVCRFVKSNAIVIARDKSTIGIGTGQPSRIDSCEIAINKMNKFQKINTGEEIVAASDAFFPFVDGIEKLVQAGITAVIQPSGSIRDKEIIKFANRTGTTLVFSKTRHFKH